MTVHENIVSGMLDLITLSDENIIKTESFDPETELTGKGVLTLDIAFIPAHPGAPAIPNYEINVVIRGMTYMSEDPEKRIIRKMFEETVRSLSVVKPDNLQAFFPSDSTVFVMLPTGEAKIEEGISEFIFALNYKIIVGNLLF